MNAIAYLVAQIEKLFEMLQPIVKIAHSEYVIDRTMHVSLSMWWANTALIVFAACVTILIISIIVYAMENKKRGSKCVCYENTSWFVPGVVSMVIGAAALIVAAVAYNEARIATIEANTPILQLLREALASTL